jgi:hypothetical protein
MKPPGAPLKSKKRNGRFVTKANPRNLSSAFETAVVAPGAPVKDTKNRFIKNEYNYINNLAQGGVNASPVKRKIVIHLHPKTPSGTGAEAKRENLPIFGEREKKHKFFIGKRLNLNDEFKNC